MTDQKPIQPKPKFFSRFRKNSLTRVLTSDSSSDQTTINSNGSYESALTSPPAVSILPHLASHSPSPIKQRFFRGKGTGSIEPNRQASKQQQQQQHAEKQGEMKDIAFEVNLNNTNVHPIDQPLQLNHKKLLPGNVADATSSTTNYNDFEKIFHELFDLTVVLSNMLCTFFISLYKLDLFINIMVSNENSIRIHAPSLTFCLVLLYLISSLSSRKYQNDHSNNNMNINTNYKPGHPIGFLIVLVFISFLLIKLFEKDGSDQTTEDPTPTTTTTTSHISDDNSLLPETTHKKQITNLPLEKQQPKQTTQQQQPQQHVLWSNRAQIQPRRNKTVPATPNLHHYNAEIINMPINDDKGYISEDDIYDSEADDNEELTELLTKRTNSNSDNGGVQQKANDYYMSGKPYQKNGKVWINNITRNSKTSGNKENANIKGYRSDKIVQEVGPGYERFVKRATTYAHGL